MHAGFGRVRLLVMSTARLPGRQQELVCHELQQSDQGCLTGASACTAGDGLLGSNRGSKGRQRSERESVGAAMEEFMPWSNKVTS